MKEIYLVFFIYEKIISVILEYGICKLFEVCNFILGIFVGFMLVKFIIGVFEVFNKF